MIGGIAQPSRAQKTDYRVMGRNRAVLQVYASRPIEESVRYRIVLGAQVPPSASAHRQKLLELSEYPRCHRTAAQHFQVQVFLLHHQHTSSIAQVLV